MDSGNDVNLWYSVRHVSGVPPAVPGRVQPDSAAIVGGCYVIKTDVPPAPADREAVHAPCTDLSSVEWAFLTARKSSLGIRPVYVPGGKSTLVHVFVVMPAYMIAQALAMDWRDLDITVEERLPSLGGLCGMHLQIGGASRSRSLKPDELNATLLRKAEVALPDAFPNRGATATTRKKLSSEHRRT